MKKARTALAAVLGTALVADPASPTQSRWDSPSARIFVDTHSSFRWSAQT